jgi:hypothetical protein
MDKFKMFEIVSFEGNTYTIISIGRRKETSGKYLINNYAYFWYHLIWVDEGDLQKVFEL